MEIGVVVEPRAPRAAEFAREAEKLGVGSLWVPEIWGYDALTGLAYLAAHTERVRLGTFIVQLGSRSPALLATSALSVQQLSGGRFILGIGVSGPKVMQGWHGVPFSRPIQATRETIDIVKLIARGERLEYHGDVYRLPLPGTEGRGLVPIVVPEQQPVYVAAMGPANLELTGEKADGWIGNAFMPEAAPVYLEPIARGAEKAGRGLADIELVAPVAVEFVADAAGELAAARRHADGYAFTIGAMGFAGTNFYANAFSRLGFEADVVKVGDLWRAGERDAARSAVPIELGRLTNLLGTPDQVRDRLAAYRDLGIGTVLAKIDGNAGAVLATLRTLVECASRL